MEGRTRVKQAGLVMTANPRRVAGQIHVTQPARKSQPPRKSQQEEEQQQPQAEAPVQNLHLAALKTAPAMQSQDIMGALMDQVLGAGPEDMLLTARTTGIASARGDGQPGTPLSRFVAESAVRDKQMLAASLAEAPRSKAQGGRAAQPQQARSGGGKKWRWLFACFS